MAASLTPRKPPKPNKARESDVKKWTRRTLETTVILQWRIIRELEGKLNRDKRQRQDSRS
jgi:hypothetical protein